MCLSSLGATATGVNCGIFNPQTNSGRPSGQRDNNPTTGTIAGASKEMGLHINAVQIQGAKSQRLVSLKLQVELPGAAGYTVEPNLQHRDRPFEGIYLGRAAC